MTSLKSLQNNFGFAYRTGLRDNAVVAGIATAFLALCYCYLPYMELKDIVGKPEYTFLLSAGMSYFRYIVIVGLIGIGILTGIITFRFITGKKTVNVYYSLGIKRTHLFSAKFLSGVTTLAISVIIPLAICFLMNVSKLGFNKYLIIAIIYNFLGLFSIAFAAFSVTSLVFSTVGTAFEGILFSGIVILFPEMFFSCTTQIVRLLVKGSPYGEGFSAFVSNAGVYAQSLSQRYPFVNPLRYFSEGIFVYSSATDKAELVNYSSQGTTPWSTPNFLPIICWILVSVLFFALAVFAYERRKAEIGGFIGKNKVLNFVGTFVISFFAFTTVITYPSRLSNMAMLAIGLAVFLVVSVILYLVLLRNLKIFKKSIVNFPIQLVIVVVIYVFFATGYFGIANKVPEAADIAYAQIGSAKMTDTVEYSPMHRYYYSGTEIELVNATHPIGKYETEKDLNFVRGVHEALVNQDNEPASFYNADFNGVYPICVQIKYVLKDGSTIYRHYYGITQEVLEMLDEADRTDYHNARLKELFYGDYDENYQQGEDTSEEYEKMQDQIIYMNNLRGSQSSACLYNNLLDKNTKLDLTAEQLQQLRDSIYKDLTEIDPKDKYHPQTTLGVISFRVPIDATNEYGGEDSYINSDGDKVYLAQNTASYVGEGETVDAFDIYYDGGINSSYPTFIITDKMTNTVELLKTLGYYDELTASSEIVSAKVIPIKAIYSSSYFTNYGYSMLNDRDPVGCEFVSIPYMDDNYNKNNFINNKNNFINGFVTKDVTAIEAMAKSSVLRATISPEDYFVFFSLNDGRMIVMYAQSENIPESIRTQADSIEIDTGW